MNPFEMSFETQTNSNNNSRSPFKSGNSRLSSPSSGSMSPNRSNSPQSSKSSVNTSPSENLSSLKDSQLVSYVLQNFDSTEIESALRNFRKTSSHLIENIPNSYSFDSMGPMQHIGEEIYPAAVRRRINSFLMKESNQSLLENLRLSSASPSSSISASMTPHGDYYPNSPVSSLVQPLLENPTNHRPSSMLLKSPSMFSLEDEQRNKLKSHSRKNSLTHQGASSLGNENDCSFSTGSLAPSAASSFMTSSSPFQPMLTNSRRQKHKQHRFLSHKKSNSTPVNQLQSIRQIKRPRTPEAYLIVPPNFKKIFLKNNTSASEDSSLLQSFQTEFNTNSAGSSLNILLTPPSPPSDCNRFRTKQVIPHCESSSIFNSQQEPTISHFQPLALTSSMNRPIWTMDSISSTHFWRIIIPLFLAFPLKEDIPVIRRLLSPYVKINKSLSAIRNQLGDIFSLQKRIKSSAILSEICSGSQNPPRKESFSTKYVSKMIGNWKRTRSNWEVHSQQQRSFWTLLFQNSLQFTQNFNFSRDHPSKKKKMNIYRSESLNSVETTPPTLSRSHSNPSKTVSLSDIDSKRRTRNSISPSPLTNAKKMYQNATNNKYQVWTNPNPKSQLTKSSSTPPSQSSLATSKENNYTSKCKKNPLYNKIQNQENSPIEKSLHNGLVTFFSNFLILPQDFIKSSYPEHHTFGTFFKSHLCLGEFYPNLSDIPTISKILFSAMYSINFIIQVQLDRIGKQARNNTSKNYNKYYPLNIFQSAEVQETHFQIYQSQLLPPGFQTSCPIDKKYAIILKMWFLRAEFMHFLRYLFKEYFEQSMRQMEHMSIHQAPSSPQNLTDSNSPSASSSTKSSETIVFTSFEDPIVAPAATYRNNPFSTAPISPSPLSVIHQSPNLSIDPLEEENEEDCHSNQIQRQFSLGVSSPVPSSLDETPLNSQHMNQFSNQQSILLKQNADVPQHSGLTTSPILQSPLTTVDYEIRANNVVENLFVLCNKVLFFYYKFLLGQ